MTIRAAAAAATFSRCFPASASAADIQLTAPSSGFRDNDANGSGGVARGTMLRPSPFALVALRVGRRR